MGDIWGHNEATSTWQDRFFSPSPLLRAEQDADRLSMDFALLLPPPLPLGPLPMAGDVESQPKTSSNQSGSTDGVLKPKMNLPQTSPSQPVHAETTHCHSDIAPSVITVSEPVSTAISLDEEEPGDSLLETSTEERHDDFMANLAAETAKFDVEFSRERSRSRSLPPEPPVAPVGQPEGGGSRAAGGDGRRDKNGHIHCNSCATVHRYRLVSNPFGFEIFGT